MQRPVGNWTENERRKGSERQKSSASFLKLTTSSYSLKPVILNQGKCPSPIHPDRPVPHFHAGGLWQRLVMILFF